MTEVSQPAQTKHLLLCHRRWPGVVMITAVVVAVATVLRLAALTVLFGKCAQFNP